MEESEPKCSRRSHVIAIAVLIYTLWSFFLAK